jgi:intracellular septation protein A
MSEQGDALTPRFGGLIESLVVSFALPLLAVKVLQHYGVSLVDALALAAVFPAGQTLFAWLRTRRLDALGAISLILIVLSVAASLISGDAHFALVKESVLTGLFGLICLASLLAPRPLMFFVGRQFATGGDAALIAEWNSRWQYPFFRKVQRTITAVWGVAYVLEATLRVVVAYTATASTTLAVSPIVGIVVTVACVIWTVRYARWAAQRGAELRAQRKTREAAAEIEQPA